MNQIKSTDFLEVYEDLGIDTGELGCIMIDTEPIVISDVIEDDDYYYSDEHKYINGNVSEDVPHVTLLYGLMRSGPELKKHVDAVLKGWEIPELVVDRVSFFYGSNDEYITVIALIRVTDELKEGNARLRLLPHIDTFDEYHPHITLAYLKASSEWEAYIAQLDVKYNGTTVTTKDLNYGE